MKVRLPGPVHLDWPAPPALVEIDFDGEVDEIVAKYRAEMEARAAKTAHRRVPMPDVEPGHCRWCAAPIMGKKGKYIGVPDPRRSWCREATEGRHCWGEFCRHSVAQSQYWFLSRERGERCAACAADAPSPARWYKDGGVSYQLDWSHGESDSDWLRCLWKTEDAPDCRTLGQFQPLTLNPGLQVDHVVPLWKVALMTDLTFEERRAFFGPTNLQLLCRFHHAEKTKAEAAERAAHRRSSCVRA